MDKPHSPTLVGLTTTLLALHIPDAVMSTLGKLLVSVAMAVLSTLASNLVNRWMKKSGNKEEKS